MAGFDFKNEEDVKKYLENISVEFGFNCLKKKIPMACHSLGEYYERIKLNYPEAAKVYKMNCDEHNFGQSCTAYANSNMYDENRTDNEKMHGMLKYYARGCELGDGRGCTNAGVMAVYSPVKSDELRRRLIKLGLSMFEIGCMKFDQGKSCLHLGETYRYGIEDFVSKDIKEAYKYFEKACELGNSQACGTLFKMHWKGKEVEMNKELAKKYYERAREMEKTNDILMQ